MLGNKRGQIFSLFMVFFTLFLCGVVIGLYFYQQGNVQSSLVSPSDVLEVRDELYILELKEVELIKSSLIEANKAGSFGDDNFKSSFRSNFIDGVWDNEDMTSFLFNGLFIGDVEIRDENKDRDLLNDGIYAEKLMSFNGDKMVFSRAKIEKRGLLFAKEEQKIDFPVYFTYEFERQYSISKNGAIVKL